MNQNITVNPKCITKSKHILNVVHWVSRAPEYSPMNNHYHHSRTTLDNGHTIEVGRYRDYKSAVFLQSISDHKSILIKRPQNGYFDTSAHLGMHGFFLKNEWFYR